jgi:hypothetical protein
MHLYNLRSLSFVVPLLVGSSAWIAPASADPVGTNYTTTFPLPGQVIDGSSVTYGNPDQGIRSTDSGYYYSSPYTYIRPQTYRRPNVGISNSVLVNPTVINGPIRNSTLINPRVVDRSYYPTPYYSDPYYPAPYYPSYYPNLQFFSVESYTRPSPEIIVDPQYGVRFKNPPGY